MNPKIFDLIIITVMAGFLLTLAHFELLEKYARFAMIPFLVFYYLGKYSVSRKYRTIDIKEENENASRDN